MTAQERDEKILGLESLVQCIARHLKRRIHSVSLEELISAAWIGAIEAIDRFDEPLGVPLQRYAACRIRGSIGDYLRTMDPLKRSHRREVREGTAAPPIAIYIDKIFESRDGSESSTPGFLRDAGCEREHQALEAAIDVTALLQRADLKPRTLTILKRRVNGELMKDIAISFGVNESRVSQICADGLRRLRAAA